MSNKQTISHTHTHTHTCTHTYTHVQQLYKPKNHISFQTFLSFSSEKKQKSKKIILQCCFVSRQTQANCKDEVFENLTISDTTFEFKDDNDVGTLYKEFGAI